MDHPHGVLEVTHVHDDAIKHVLVDPIPIEVDQTLSLPDALERRLHAQLLEVRPHEPVRALRQHPQVDVVPEPHVARLDLQDLEPPLLVGYAHVELAVEPAGPP